MIATLKVYLSLAALHTENLGIEHLIRNITAFDDPSPFADAPTEITHIPIEAANVPGKLVLDPAGYFIVYPDRTNKRLVLEHYNNKGVLDRMLTDITAAPLYITAIEAGLISRLDHAAYLGHELTRAEHVLHHGGDYIQDRAPGEMKPPKKDSTQQITTTCGCQPDEGESCN